MAAAARSPRKSGKKSKKGKGMKSPSRPRTADMVAEAINALKDRKGSSLSAIKKYIAAHYKVDAARLAPFIRMAVKNGVAAGTFKQVSGTGASGKFRMNTKAEVGKKGKKATTPKKAKKEKKVKKPNAQKKAKKAKAQKGDQKSAKAAKQPKKAKKQKKTKKGGKKSKRGRK